MIERTFDNVPCGTTSTIGRQLQGDADGAPLRRTWFHQWQSGAADHERNSSPTQSGSRSINAATVVGEGQGLAQLIERYAAELEQYVRRWSDAPQDVAQEAFLQLVRQKECPRHVVPWLYRVARNRAISRGRSLQRRREHERRAATQVPAWSFSADDSRLDAATATEQLAELLPERREVVVSHLWGGLTFRQIGRRMGVSTSTAYRRYQAALVDLRKKLGVSQPG